DLVGPEPHLRAEQPTRSVGAAQRRRAVHREQPAERSGRLVQGGLMSSTNGSVPETTPASFSGADAIAALRTKPRNVLLFRGFGPLVAAIVLFLMMLVLAPSVAPEHIVVRPVSGGATTTTVSTTTTVIN